MFWYLCNYNRQKAVRSITGVDTGQALIMIPWEKMNFPVKGSLVESVLLDPDYERQPTWRSDPT
jgi:hypothetical protein